MSVAKLLLKHSLINSITIALIIYAHTVSMSFVIIYNGYKQPSIFLDYMNHLFYGVLQLMIFINDYLGANYDFNLHTYLHALKSSSLLFLYTFISLLFIFSILHLFVYVSLRRIKYSFMFPVIMILIYNLVVCIRSVIWIYSVSMFLYVVIIILVYIFICMCNYMLLKNNMYTAKIVSDKGLCEI